MRKTAGNPLFGWMFVVALFMGLGLPAAAQTSPRPTTVRRDVHHDVSLPLIDLIRKARPAVQEQHEAEPMRSIPLPAGMRPLADDPVRQWRTSGFSPLVSQGFEGIGNGVYGFYPVFSPPDTNGAVGATQYVQWVNAYFGIFDKTTGGLVGPIVAGNVLWMGFGGGCEGNNDGDPIVLYDKLAQRWVMSQFSVSTGPYLQCIAVSTTPDATGTWHRYSFQYSDFDDYPKMGVWSDAYYETFNMFDDDTFVGSDACAYDRNAMLNGQTATQVCFQQGPDVGGLLPSDIDGATPPPSGSPNYMLTFGVNSLRLYKFHVDFSSPSNSTFTGPTAISVAAFSPLCGGSGNCVPQPGTSNTLDSLGDRLMYRLAYRNFGDHESLVVNHSVATNGSGGVRWYEVQAPNAVPLVAQQGTYAPDSSYRWMGSIAMDKAADIALGYSVSSGAVYPSIAFAGRVATDPPGELEAETTIVNGSGSQTGNLTRWGDYSAMTIDPVDDCTFWYTQEYMVTNGAWNWNTRIVNFKFPGCSSGSYVGFFPTSLNFGTQQIGTGSTAQSIVISNHQPVSLAISGIAIAGDYSQSNNCGRSLPANSNCTINVTFRPTAAGTRSGSLTVTDNGPGSPRTTSLTGLGMQPEPCILGTLSNADFENGTLNCWTVGGALPPVISTLQPHNGSFSAQLGANGIPEPDGDSSIYQAITVPAGSQRPTLTFWYWPGTDDSIQYSWQEAQIRDPHGNMLAQVFKVSSNAQAWVQVTYDLTAYIGQSVQLYFNVHEDGAGYPSYMYLDDLAIAEGTTLLRLVPLTPCRVVDTRNAPGTFGGPALAANTSRDFPLPQGACGIPSTAAAYALNITVAPQGHLGFLTVWPTGGSQPSVSTLNSLDGRIKANAAIVPAGENQAVSVFASGATDVVLDINGYFASSDNNSALAFFPLTPCRVVDTRNPNGPLAGPTCRAAKRATFPCSRQRPATFQMRPRPIR